MLKIAICDDNAVQLQIIREELKKNIGKDLSYSVDTFDGETAFDNMLQSGSCPYNIVFMDIVLGDKATSGIELIHKVNFLNPACQVIYISQYLEFAADVYDTQHVYFLNKDRISELFGKALHAALKNISQTINILYMERNLRETTIVTRTEEFKISEKIDLLLQRLPSYFVSCHRSYAVNLRLVSSIHQYAVAFPNGKSIPVGRTHYADVKKSFALMNSYIGS